MIKCTSASVNERAVVCLMGCKTVHYTDAVVIYAPWRNAKSNTEALFSCFGSHQEGVPQQRKKKKTENDKNMMFAWIRDAAASLHLLLARAPND